MGQRGVIWWDLCVAVCIHTVGVKGRTGRPTGGNCDDAGMSFVTWARVVVMEVVEK